MSGIKKLAGLLQSADYKHKNLVQEKNDLVDYYKRAKWEMWKREKGQRANRVVKKLIKAYVLEEFKWNLYK